MPQINSWAPLRATVGGCSERCSLVVTDGSRATFTFDAVGNRTSKANSASATTWTYDAVDRVASMTADGVAPTYTYNAIGQRKTMLDADSVETKYTYDAADRMTQVNKPVTTFVYDANDRTFGNYWLRSRSLVRLTLTDAPGSPFPRLVDDSENNVRTPYGLH